MLALSIRITGWLTTVADRLARRIQRVPSAIPALGREEGQTTAEYALVILAAAAVALVLIAWAKSSGKLPAFFDSIIDNITGNVG
jgi:Flp pilus assembly pilin Flp